MRHALSAVILLGTLVASPAVGFAGPAPAKTAPSKASLAAKPAKAAVGTHSTVGIVRSVNANALVLTRRGKKHGEMTFTLEPSTNEQGVIAVGSSVSVRYRVEGKSHVATAVTVRQPAKSAKH